VKAFRVISRDTYWKSAADRWESMHLVFGSRSAALRGHSLKIYNRLVEAKSADEVDQIIGSPAMTSERCVLCESDDGRTTVEMLSGEVLDMDIYVCLSCLEKAAAAIRSEEQK
jgi:hypothetical protein